MHLLHAVNAAQKRGDDFLEATYVETIGVPNDGNPENRRLTEYYASDPERFPEITALVQPVDGADGHAAQ